ncbi:RAB2A [Symbiodinium natans]|uniref:RAB2A protein n=1 Tax=Symbiodinium natans TaxID=878477 RepID=A0A812T0Q3_9DINO|nr:RAB2A [Symbiodinium natans]
MGGDSKKLAEKLVNGPSLPHFAMAVARLCASGSAFAALRTDGTVVSWGDASCQQFATEVQQLIATQYSFAALRSDGKVIAWGPLNSHELVGVQQLVASAAAFAALRHDGTVVSWGSSEFGGDCQDVAGRLTEVKAVVAARCAFEATAAEPAAYALIRETGAVTSLSPAEALVQKQYLWADCRRYLWLESGRKGRPFRGLGLCVNDEAVKVIAQAL